MARKQRSDKGKPRKRTVTPDGQVYVAGAVVPKGGRKVADGPTTGYKDGPDGVVLVMNFDNGYLPDGWHDSPAECDNCDGKSHPVYEKVEE